MGFYSSFHENKMQAQCSGKKFEAMGYYAHALGVSRLRIYLKFLMNISCKCGPKMQESV